MMMMMMMIIGVLNSQVDWSCTHLTSLSLMFTKISPIDLPHIIPLWCVRTIELERVWGGHFHMFLVFFVHPSLDSAPLFVGMLERSIL